MFSSVGPTVANYLEEDDRVVLIAEAWPKFLAGDVKGYEATIVERAWAKRSELRSLIRTDAIDIVANRVAAVRAQPSLGHIRRSRPEFPGRRNR